MHAALRDGACGFLLKCTGPTLRVEAVRAAMAGDALISPSITVRLLDQLGRPDPDEPEEPLTARERKLGVRNRVEIAAWMWDSGRMARPKG